MLSIKTILHPTDFSTQADYAFQLACSLARDYGARVVVLHVSAPPVVAYGEAITGLAYESSKDQALEALHRITSSDAKVKVEHQLEEGDPVAEILRVAREQNCDLIAMGTHGRSALGRLLMGSVAEPVVRKAPCPVLTVKSPKHMASEREAPAPKA